MINIFIGYDEKESIAYHVLSHSLLSNSTQPLAITPVCRDNLASIFTRPRGEFDATDFSNSRWIVPCLMNYEGWAIFMDCDMVCTTDIAKLWELRDDKYAIMCRKHVHVPRETTKFLGQAQSLYPRKNWSSLMLMNCSKLKMLSKHMVNTQMGGLWYHQMSFLPDEEIGDLPVGWNVLLGYDDSNASSELLHYTTLGPWHAPHKVQEIDRGLAWAMWLERMIRGNNPHALDAGAFVTTISESARGIR